MDVTRIMNRAKDVAGVKAQEMSAKVESPAQEEAEESPTRFKGPKGVKWIVFRSKVLDDRFVLVYDKKDLKEAREAHPDKAIYFPPEIEDLISNADDVDHIKAVHLVKKEFGGWIIPKDSPLYRRYTENKGGSDHGTVERGEKKAGK